MALSRIRAGEKHHGCGEYEMPLKVPQTLNKRKALILSNHDTNVTSVHMVLFIIRSVLYITKSHMSLCKYSV